MATVYHRDQAGAPGLAYTNNSNGIQQFTALKTILKACLVTGYGAQPAAGWELINEGVNFIVLRNGSHSGYICLTYASSSVEVYLAETYVGMSGDVMAGDGLISGTSAGSSPKHKLNITSVVSASVSSSWALIADAKTFILTNASYPNASNYSLTEADGSSANSHRTFYAGEDTGGAFIACGGKTTSYSSGSVESTFNASGFTALKNPLTGLLVAPGGLMVQTPGLRSLADWSYSTVPVLLEKVELAHLPWFGDGAHSGYFRGLAMTPTLQEYPMPGYAAKALGASIMLTYRTGNTSIDLGDGYTYFPRLTTYLLPFFLVTNNPEFW